MKCEKCKNYFSSSKVIDGKKRNLKSRKYCLECSPFGKHNTQNLLDDKNPKDKKQCYLCKETLEISSFYATKKKISSECKKCNKLRVNESLRERKKILVDTLGGKCMNCGYSKNINALTFHHRDANEKSFTVASRLTSNIETLLEEIKKCDLLCANCHAEHHSNCDMGL